MDDKEDKQEDLVKDNPLLHAVVLRNLFTFMKDDDIKTARLVCREWNDNATIELGSRREWVRLHDFPRPADSKRGCEHSLHSVDEFLDLNMEQCIMSNRGLKCLEFRRISFCSFRFATSFMNFFDPIGPSLTHLFIGILSYTDGHCLLEHMPFQMPNMKVLRVTLFTPNNSSIRRNNTFDQLAQNSSGKRFLNNKLESFNITDFSTFTRTPALEWSLILDTCPKLQKLTLATNSGNIKHILKLMSDFRAAYARNRNILSLKLKTEDSSLAFFQHEHSNEFVAFVNLFKLGKLQFEALMPGDELNYIFRNINPPSEKLCLKNLIGSERGTSKDLFKVFSPIGHNFKAPKHVELHFLQDIKAIDEMIWGPGAGDVSVSPGILSLSINTMDVGMWTNTITEEMMKLIPIAMPNLVKVNGQFKTASSLKMLLRNFTALKHLRELDITCHAKGRWAVKESDLFGSVDRWNREASSFSYIGLKGLSNLKKLTLRIGKISISGKKAREKFLQLSTLKYLCVPESLIMMMDEADVTALKQELELRLV